MAFFKGSWYEDLPPFDPPEDGTRGFRGTRARAIPAPQPVLEHGVAVGDRIDQLGQNYYGNPRDWRRLADGNPDVIFPEDLVWDTAEGEVAHEKTGETLLVPRRREGTR
ncbi:hypothetical protein [Mesobacterium pallidum]|uniref:hypothetical protein n=1 Tax=Mesobacterium pallidum TaxID=2872037 RepID=UPI001EE37472|nr:hypothetical protein [Mesobacterium pallidum]